MSTPLKKKDLRIIRTNKTLIKALLALLNKRSFKKISVNDICGEALISRAAFYAHFNSKYDLLQHWLQSVAQGVPDNIFTYSETDIINQANLFIDNNQKIIKNIVDDPDELIVESLQEFTLAIINKFKAQEAGDATYRMMSIFCAGGLYGLLKWHSKNRCMLEIEWHTMLKFIMAKK